MMGMVRMSGSDLLDALAYLRLHLLGLPFDEVNLVYEQLDLER